MSLNGLPLALIIEDDAKLSDVFDRALKSAKYATEIVHDGATAIQKLSHMTPSLVILDLHLPDITGDQILHHIQADERLKHTRIIIASADGRKAQELQERGIFVLLKPVSYVQLRNMASRLHPNSI